MAITVELYTIYIMLGALIVILAILWFLGYINISGIDLPNVPLFTINAHVVSLVDLLILAIVGIAISILPSPFREISGVLLILWVLSVLGILSIAGIGLSSIIVLAIILGLIVSLFRHTAA